MINLSKTVSKVADVVQSKPAINLTKGAVETAQNASKKIDFAKGVATATNPISNSLDFMATNNIVGLNIKKVGQAIKNQDIFPKEGICAMKFNQQKGIGDLNDCYFVSSILSIAKNPKTAGRLDDIIQKSGDGWDVAYKNSVVHISQDDLKKGIKGFNAQTDCDGFKILETAYAKLGLSEEYLSNPNAMFANIKGTSGTGGKFGGRQAVNVMGDIFAETKPMHITASYYDKNCLGDDEYRKIVSDIFDDFSQNETKYCLVGGTGKSAKQHAIDSVGGYKFCSRHAYSILGTDSANKIVKVVDPYNTSKTLEISYDDFFKLFNTVDGVLV